VASANDCVVSVDEREIPDIAAWMEQRKHAITFGKSSGSTMLFELKGTREALEEPTGRWETLGTIPAQKVEQCLKFKPSKKFSTIEFAADGTLKFGSLARKADGQMHLTRPAYRQLISACQKMKAWAPGLSFEKRKEQLRVSAAIGTDLSVFAYVGIE
jgi:hypothetical protein